MMRGTRFRHGSANLISLRLETKLAEDDMPLSGWGRLKHPVCTENPIRVDDVMESPKLAE